MIFPDRKTVAIIGSMVDLACHLTEKVWPSALVKSATSIWVPIDLHLVVNWQAIVPLQIHFHVVLDPWYWWCKEMLQHVSDLPIQLFSGHFNRLLSYESYTIHDYPMNPGRLSLIISFRVQISWDLPSDPTRGPGKSLEGSHLLQDAVAPHTKRHGISEAEAS